VHDDDSITWSEASSTLVKLLQFITDPGDDLAKCGARAHLVVMLLSPEQCRYKSLRELAEACGVTKQNLSKILMDYRRSLSLGLNLGKRAYSSDSYRAAALRSVDEGRHFTSSRKRANSK